VGNASTPDVVCAFSGEEAHADTKTHDADTTTKESRNRRHRLKRTRTPPCGRFKPTPVSPAHIRHYVRIGHRTAVRSAL